MPQAVVTQGEHNFKLSKAVEWFIIGLGHLMLDTGYWLLVIGCSICIFFDVRLQY